MSRKMSYILLILAVVFWGTSFAVVKLGIGQLEPVQFLFLRNLFASLIFVAILMKTPREQRYLERQDIPRMFFLAFMGVGGYFIVQYTALQYTTTVNASLLVGIAPIIVAIYSALFLKEKLGWVRAFGIGISFAGIVLTITRGHFAGFINAETILGDLLMILNAVMISIFSLGSKSMLKKYEPIVATAYLSIMALVMLIPFNLFSNFLAPVPLWKMASAIDGTAVLAAFYLALTCSVIGYFGWYQGIKTFGATKTSVFNYINPLVAAVLSYILFDGELTVFTVIGGVCIIGGVYLCNMKRQPTTSNS